MQRRMILCAGLQSGGTTLISWCFLQRRDTNGVLDMPHDNLRIDFSAVNDAILWVKMTIGAFRWSDVSAAYHDLGWHPEPLLVVRDVRAAFASLIKKDYGFNGTTAEEPPLRMRFRRFLEDWILFQRGGWPIIRYEDLLHDARATLLTACERLGLSWDEAMAAWPKDLSQIAYVGPDPNQTFAKSISARSLSAAIQTEKAGIGEVPASELDWLEVTFADYNKVHGYPATVQRSVAKSEFAIPRFEGTARHWYLSELERLREEEANRLYGPHAMQEPRDDP